MYSASGEIRLASKLRPNARGRPGISIRWVVALALVVRLAVIPVLGPDNENLYEYGQIAWNIVQGHGFSFDFEGRFPLQPTAYAPALYSYALVPWFAVFGLHLTGPRIMHAALLASACWFLFKIGEKLAGRMVGLTAALIWAIYPELIFLTVRIVPENAMFLPMIWLLYLTLDISERDGKWRSLGRGALLGVSAWINPSLQLLGLIVPLYWWIAGGLKGWKGLRRVSLFVLGAILVIAPWTVRNYIELGAFVPLRTAFAYNVWRGNHIGATGTVRTFAGTDVDEAIPDVYRHYVEAHMVPNEIERDRFFAGEVKRFIREHPDKYLKLALTRFFYFWWKDLTHPLTRSPFYWIPWSFILLLAAIGAYQVRKDWKRWSLWGLQIIGFTLFFSLTIVLPRYRMPIYPAMFLLAAVGVSTAYQKMVRRDAFYLARKSLT